VICGPGCHTAVRCSAVQCSAVQCSAVQCSAVQCTVVQCSGPGCHTAVINCALTQAGRGGKEEIKSVTLDRFSGFDLIGLDWFLLIVSGQFGCIA
jgi:hypothetical protein